MNIAFWLRRQVAVRGDAPAIFHGTEEIADYRQFDAEAAAVAGWLVAEGVAPGDRVALFFPNAPVHLPLLFGIWYAGAAAVPINAKLHPREAAYILDDSETRLAFVDPGQIDALAALVPETRCVAADATAELRAHAPIAAPVEVAPGDLAWLFYTSGTTGRPKGVMITHRMLISVSLAYSAEVDAPKAEDSILYAAPMSHGAGLYAMIHVLVGARHVVPRSGGFDPAEIFELARHHGNIQMFAAPTMVKRLTDAATATGETGAGLRTVVYAGGPMYLADILEAVDTFGPIFVQIYGQGECPMGITVLSRAEVADRSHPDWRARLASVGRAQSTVEVRIGDEDGAPLPPGETGEIMVKGDPIMPGYWKNPDATAATLVDGWLRTGDMGFMDRDGYVTMQDRSKDMIITGGSNVYPREVEEVLLEHPDLAEVSVIGRPHPDWGEEVVAVIVGTASESDLNRLCLDRIARFKRPKAYIRVAALPKNNYGKVLKTELRKRFAR